MPARSSAAVTAWMPRSTAGTSENAPMNLPTGVRAPSTMIARCTISIIGGGLEGLCHVPDQAAALLFCGASPDAVPLAVLDGPGQAHLTNRADAAVGQREASLLFGGGEEDLRIEAVASRSFLPMVRRAHLLREAPHVDLRIRHRVHANCSVRQRPGPISCLALVRPSSPRDVSARHS